LAAMNHEQQQKFFPTAGWLWQWAGDPLRGYGRTQGGGWAYQILPFCEQEALWNMPNDGDPDNITSAQKLQTDKMLQSPLAMFNCPSRRPVGTYALTIRNRTSPFLEINSSNTLTQVARTDYAANAGDYLISGHEENFINIPSGSLSSITSYTAAINYYNSYYSGGWPDNHLLTGVMIGATLYCCEVRMSDITDGTSNTYLVGEKAIPVNHYLDGESDSDNQYLYVGCDRDLERFAHPTNTKCVPTQDSSTAVDVDAFSFAFGAAHTSGFYMAFCDGSVQMISYTIDRYVHSYLSNRKDGVAFDAKQVGL
jgi:hypothetical protein